MKQATPTVETAAPHSLERPVHGPTDSRTAPPQPHPGLFGEGWFTALGAGGQYGFVKPALDLVVVLRVDRDQRLPEPKFTEFEEFVQLVAKAGGL